MPLAVVPYARSRGPDAVAVEALRPALYLSPSHQERGRQERGEQPGSDVRQSRKGEDGPLTAPYVNWSLASRPLVPLPVVAVTSTTPLRRGVKWR